jgi:hypothetical protein
MLHYHLGNAIVAVGGAAYLGAMHLPASGGQGHSAVAYGICIAATAMTLRYHLVLP